MNCVVGANQKLCKIALFDSYACFFSSCSLLSAGRNCKCGTRIKDVVEGTAKSANTVTAACRKHLVETSKTFVFDINFFDS